MKPLAIDLFCGLGGWAEGLIAEGFYVVGFDVERHDYGTGGYPGQLVIQDVLTLHGSQFRNAAVIVASPPCTEYSYMAMPWSRSKQIARALRGNDDFPEGYKGSRTIEQLNALFNACFRIQREACEAAGRHIPLIVENVKGAQPWVGRAKWNFGSFYLWGDVPALMPITFRGERKTPVGSWDMTRKNYNANHSWEAGSAKIPGQNWSRYKETGKVSPHWRMQADGRKSQKPSGGSWFGEYGLGQGSRNMGSNSKARKAASAQIAKIPLPLARHIAQVFCTIPEEGR